MSDDPALTCPACGYELEGLSGARCPECGQAFTITAADEPEAHPRWMVGIFLLQMLLLIIGTCVLVAGLIVYLRGGNALDAWYVGTGALLLDVVLIMMFPVHGAEPGAGSDQGR